MLFSYQSKNILELTVETVNNHSAGSSKGNNDHTSEQEAEKVEQTMFPIDETGLVNEVKFKNSKEKQKLVCNVYKY